MKIDWLDELSIYKKVSEFDIGLSPLVDHEFNTAKSAFKVKQYFSCGVPAIASHIGENVTFIQNGLNGFLCSDQDEFKEKILLINAMQSDQYEQLSANTRIDLDSFSIKSYCDRLLFAIQNKNVFS